MKLRIAAAVVLAGLLATPGPAVASQPCTRYTVSVGPTGCLWLREGVAGRKVGCKAEASIVHGPGVERDGWTQLYRGVSANETFVWVASAFLVDARPADRC